MSSNLVGQVIFGRYRVDAFIDAGGMGTVYRIWDLSRNVPLAMKVLHADLSEDPTAYKMFQREADALMKLAHPHIVPFYGLFQTPSFSFFLEHYVDGNSLKNLFRLRRTGPMSIGEALVYLKALSSALGYAHVNGIVHCDIKPGNVLLDHGGNIFLTDFGIARHSNSTTTTMKNAGTPAYMAPEQIRSEPVTPQTDVYALGILFYELLTGRRPFLGNEPESEPYGASTDQRIFFAHLSLPPADPSTINPAIPLALSQVILQALEKDPTMRYRGAMEFYLAACQAADTSPDTLPDRIVFEKSLPAETYPVYAVPEQPWRPPQTTPIDNWTPPSAPPVPVYPPVQPQNRLPWVMGGIAVISIIAIIGAVFLIKFLTGGDRTAMGQTPPNPSQVSYAGPTRTPDWSAGVNPTSPAIDQPVTQPPLSQDPSLTPWSTNTPPMAKTPAQAITPTKVDFKAPLYKPIAECLSSSHIHPGDWVMVSYGGGHNALRSTPDTHPTDNRIGYAEAGELLFVTDGPVCNYDWLLWKVKTSSGLEGWTPETNAKEFWLDPFPSYTACPGSANSLLHKGDQAQVTLFPPTPNRIRSEPTIGSDNRIGTVEAGGLLTILDGPQCNDGYVWWQVQSQDGLTGWTAEGDSSTFYIVPVPAPHE